MRRIPFLSMKWRTCGTKLAIMVDEQRLRHPDFQCEDIKVNGKQFRIMSAMCPELRRHGNTYTLYVRGADKSMDREHLHISEGAEFLEDLEAALRIYNDRVRIYCGEEPFNQEFMRPEEQNIDTFSQHCQDLRNLFKMGSFGAVKHV